LEKSSLSSGNDKYLLIDLDQRVGEVIGKSPEREAASGEDEGKEVLPRDDWWFLGIRTHDACFVLRVAAYANVSQEMSYRIQFVELKIRVQTGMGSNPSGMLL
jgi:hypothetical protein